MKDNWTPKPHWFGLGLLQSQIQSNGKYAKHSSWRPLVRSRQLSLSEKWELNFVPEAATTTHTAIWIRLLQLPTEFYDRMILDRIGKKLGKLLKIDSCTSSTLRGRYARICIQVPLDQPVKNEVQFDNYTQKVIYEGEGNLCTCCGRLGHVQRNYAINLLTEKNKDTPSTSKSPRGEWDWKVVSFPKKKKHTPPNTTKQNSEKPLQRHHSPQVRGNSSDPGMSLPSSSLISVIANKLAHYNLLVTSSITTIIGSGWTLQRI